MSFLLLCLCSVMNVILILDSWLNKCLLNWILILIILVCWFCSVVNMVLLLCSEIICFVDLSLYRILIFFIFDSWFILFLFYFG